jgi:hypothetical protein
MEGGLDSCVDMLDIFKFLAHVALKDFLVRDLYGSTEEDLNILLYDLEQVSRGYPCEAADSFFFYGRALLALCNGEEGEEEEGDILLGITWSWLATAKLLYTTQKQVVSPEEGKILER